MTTIEPSYAHYAPETLQQAWDHARRMLVLIGDANTIAANKQRAYWQNIVDRINAEAEDRQRKNNAR